MTLNLKNKLFILPHCSVSKQKLSSRVIQQVTLLEITSPLRHVEKLSIFSYLSAVSFLLSTTLETEVFNRW